MTKKAAPKSRKGALALSTIAELAFSKGAAAARTALEAVVEKPSDFQVVKAGSISRRRDASDADEISYSTFGPPSSWEAPYSLLRVRFGVTKARPNFMFHSGEEILAPISGAIMYQFIFGQDGRTPERVQLKEPLVPGQIVRVNPQVPHQTWAMEGGAEAWMAFRDLSDEAAAISAPARSSARVSLSPSSMRRVDEQTLKTPEKYALIAWGIAERIRFRRERANLSISELAEACDMDPAHVSRIEAAKTNVSIEVLKRIADVLHIDLHDLLTPPMWHRQTGQLVSSARLGRQSLHHRPFAKRGMDEHRLHADGLQIPTEATASFPGTAVNDARQFDTFIVTKGQVVAGISDRAQELVSDGSVIHIRGSAKVRFTALKPSTILRIRCSSHCICVD